MCCGAYSGGWYGWVKYSVAWLSRQDGVLEQTTALPMHPNAGEMGNAAYRFTGTTADYKER